MKIEAAITGWGWRTPLGHDIEPAIDRLLAGERAVKAHTVFGESHGYACGVSATIEGAPARTPWLDR